MYARGRKFEWRVRDHLEGMGFVVVRSAASKPVDLVAMRGGQILLIECKYNAKITSLERQRLLKMAERAGGIPVLATKRRGQRGFKLIDLRGMTELEPP